MWAAFAGSRSSCWALALIQPPPAVGDAGTGSRGSPCQELSLALLLPQVISLDLRSQRKKPNGHGGTSEGNGEEEELRYTHMLNRVLPPDIRVLAWAPVEPDFSARFSCLQRTYRYFFPCADLDVALMDAAAQRFVGTHDFRNLCKMDVANGVVNFQRTILSAGVTWTEGGGEELGVQDPFRLCQFEVTGQAFLYHQVRCMMAILFLIGQRMESPEVIDELLDVEKNPRKPQYRCGELRETLPGCLGEVSIRISVFSLSKFWWV